MVMYSNEGKQINADVLLMATNNYCAPSFLTIPPDIVLSELCITLHTHPGHLHNTHQDENTEDELEKY